MKARYVVGFLVLMGCVGVWLRFDHRPRAVVNSREVERGKPVEASQTPAAPLAGETRVQADRPGSTVEQAAPTPPPTLAPPPVVPEVVAAPVAPRDMPSQISGRRSNPSRGTMAAPEPVVPKPVARAALGYVGADPDAEEIWVNAINDPNRSADERKDLIEDLNEDGFPDPKNITEDDLPLIVSRLALIEELAPDAADEVNEAAFAEAYKDLLNMLAKLSRN